MKYILIGGAWPYANGSLHIGHVAAATRRRSCKILSSKRRSGFMFLAVIAMDTGDNSGKTRR